MTNTELLKYAGLDEKEARIYTALVKSGPLNVATISEKTNIHRPIIYKKLASLQEKSLVSVSPIGKRKFFVAAHPDKLKGFFDKAKQDFESLLPEIRNAYEQRKLRPHVKFLESRTGITSVFEDLVTSLKKGDVFLRYSSPKDLKKAERYLPKNYKRIRDNKHLERFIITNTEIAARKKPSLNRAMKVLPSTDIPANFNVTELIYGKKIAFIDYNSETALVIENEAIAEFSRSIFKALYKRL